MNADFWKNKRVALFGGASLIGSHLAEALVDVAKEVWIVDDYSIGKPENIPLGVIGWEADLREYQEVREFFIGVDPIDVVFHLASQHGGRGYVSGHQVELYDNLSLDGIVFRACSDLGVGQVVFSSSACAYPVHLQTDPTQEFRLSEDMIDYKNLQQADGAYGTEKLVGECMLDAYIERGDFVGCSTRSYTVYGPRMNESQAIAALIAKAMLRLDPYPVWGDGKQIRNWTYVEDNVQGAILAAENLNRGSINIGTRDRLTPLDAMQIIFDYMGWHPSTIEFQTDKPTGPLNRTADPSLLESLGWKPKYSFEEGVRKTVDWYVSTHKVEDLRETLERKLTER